MKIIKKDLLLLLPGILLLWIWGSRVPQTRLPSNQIEAPKESFLAPDFILETRNGEPTSLTALRGQPIILNFWASWCPPCRAEMPAFERARIEYLDTDLVILAVNATHQDSISNVNDFITEHNLDMTILLDSSGIASSKYQIHSLPTTFMINREGVITKTLIGGPIPLSTLRVHANQLLQEIQDVPNN